MRASIPLRALATVALSALVLVAAAPAGADLRTVDRDVVLHDHELTVDVALLDPRGPADAPGCCRGWAASSCRRRSP